ncbi:MAG: two-component system sensor histidine kinase NtrB [Planctomycetota bacterium]|jgi:signal transduction histidine kinase
MPDNHDLHAQRQKGVADTTKPTGMPPSAFGPLGESIIQSLPLGVLTFDSDLRIIDSNPKAAELIDLDGDIDKSLAKGTNAPGRPGLNWTKHLNATLRKAGPVTLDNVTYNLNGQTRLLRITSTPLTEPGTKRVTAGVLLIEDVTEKADVQRRLYQAEKLAAVGKLASEVAHELNNPMDGILRYINLALRIVDQQDLQKPKEYLTQSRQGLLRMVHIVSDLLEFGRTTCAPFEHVKIESVIDDAIKTMGARAEALNVQISRTYAADLPQIRGDNLFQVFCNLIKNALDAMPDGGQLSISTRLAPDNTVVVEFRDTGAGFDPENAEAIFEPFFTTKHKGKGTGLGLAICKDIVERYHGRITAQNHPDAGSIFTVYLPTTDQVL